LTILIIIAIYSSTVSARLLVVVVTTAITVLVQLNTTNTFLNPLHHILNLHQMEARHHHLLNHLHLSASTLAFKSLHLLHIPDPYPLQTLSFHLTLHLCDFLL
jgi:hypothetical protein